MNPSFIEPDWRLSPPLYTRHKEYNGTWDRLDLHSMYFIFVLAYPDIAKHKKTHLITLMVDTVLVFISCLHLSAIKFVNDQVPDTFSKPKVLGIKFLCPLLLLGFSEYLQIILQMLSLDQHFHSSLEWIGVSFFYTPFSPKVIRLSW